MLVFGLYVRKAPPRQARKKTNAMMTVNMPMAPATSILGHKPPSLIPCKAVPRKSQRLIVIGLNPDLSECEHAEDHETKDVANRLSEK